MFKTSPFYLLLLQNGQAMPATTNLIYCRWGNHWASAYKARAEGTP